MEYDYENCCEIELTMVTSEKEAMEIFSMLRERVPINTSKKHKGNLAIRFEDKVVEANVFIASVTSPEFVF